MVKILHIIDSVSEWMDKIFSWFLLIITIITTVEVIMRYVFNHPTTVSWDINVMLLAAIVVTGGATTELRGGHISIDILVVRLSAKKRALLDVFLYIMAILGISLLLWKVAQNALWSVIHLENYTSVLMPPIYPLKVLMVVGIAWMLIQMLATLIRKLQIVVGVKEITQ